jgi:hypothetical protein
VENKLMPDTLIVSTTGPISLSHETILTTTSVVFLKSLPTIEQALAAKATLDGLGDKATTIVIYGVATGVHPNGVFLLAAGSPFVPVRAVDIVNVQLTAFDVFRAPTHMAQKDLARQVEQIIDQFGQGFPPSSVRP